MKYYITPVIYCAIIFFGVIMVASNQMDIPGVGDSEVYFTLTYNDGSRLDVTAANVDPTTLNSSLDYPCINYSIDSGFAELTNPQPQKYYLLISKPFAHDRTDTVRYDARLAKGDEYFIEICAVANDSLLNGVAVDIW